jgi:SAM-dependent methyltransferase
MNVSKVIRALLGRNPVMAKYRCNVCDHKVWKFLPFGRGSKSVPAFVRAINLTGSDVDNFECPWCGASDRERHLLMYMRASGIFDSLAGKEILHFAPEKRIAGLVAAQNPRRHIQADLKPTRLDIERIDMQEIPYPDESFDLVIANHVLEHVSDDLLALQELRRVLKVNGHAILQTPFSSKVHNTWYDRGIDDDESRLQAYGQEDHVRLFGKDIFDRIASSGLTSKVQLHDELLPDVNARTFGVNRSEPFFLFERTA